MSHCREPHKATNFAENFLKGAVANICYRMEEEGVKFRDDSFMLLIEEEIGSYDFPTLLQLAILPEIAEKEISGYGPLSLFSLLDIVLTGVIEEGVKQELLFQKAKKTPCQCKPRYQFYPEVAGDGTFYCPDCKIVLSAEDWVESNSLHGKRGLSKKELIATLRSLVENETDAFLKSIQYDFKRVLEEE